MTATKTTATTLTIDGRTFTADWVRSEDAGYSAGKLLLDLPSGEYFSVYRHGAKWIAAIIRDNICRRSSEYKTRGEALHAATSEYAAAVLLAESF